MFVHFLQNSVYFLSTSGFYNFLDKNTFLFFGKFVMKRAVGNKLEKLNCLSRRPFGGLKSFLTSFPMT